MAIDKLIPQYLNSDTDQKLVKSVEMTDNLNVRVSNNDEGTAGVLKNVKGTTELAPKTVFDAFPSGENRVIGSVSNEKNNEVLFFLWNSNNAHGIYRIDTLSDSFEKIYEDTVLNFSKLSFVDADIVMNEQEETLLYWTDNINPPMKINVNRFLSGDYPASVSSGTDEEKLLSLTVAKRPPLSAPSYNIVNNPDLGYSNIFQKNFQFAYQYKYKDGEVSALSPFSSLSVSASQFKDGFITESAKDFYNQIDVYVRHSEGDVDEIIVYARNGNTGAFFEIETIQNVNGSSVATVNFTDNKVSRYLSNDELNKSYDNVPQKAKSLCIANNRLMFGNFVEGYENTVIDAELEPVYHAQYDTFNISVSHNGTQDIVIEEGTSSGISEVSFDIDFSEVPATIQDGTVVSFSFTVTPDYMVLQEEGAFGTFGTLDFEYLDPVEESIEKITVDTGSLSTVKIVPQAIIISNTYNISGTLTKSAFINQVSSFLTSDVFTAIVDAEKKEKYKSYDTVGGISGQDVGLWYSGISKYKFVQNSIVGDVLTVDIRFAGAEIFVKDAEIQGGSWLTRPFSGFKPVTVLASDTIEIGGESGYSEYPSANTANPVKYIDYAVSSSSSFGGVIEGMKSYKSNARHSFGIVYLDSRGRASGVNEIQDVFIKPQSSRQRKGGASLELRVKNDAPSWAVKWMPVYAGNNQYESFIQYTTGNAVVGFSSASSNGSPLSKKVLVSMATLEGEESSYIDQTGARIEYKYEQGDRIKVLRYRDASGNLVYPSDIEFDVVEYKYIGEDEGKNFVKQNGSDPDVGGWYLTVDSRDVDGFSFEDVLSNSDFWDNECVVEIRKPKKEVDEKVYYDFGKVYDVDNGTHIGERTESVLTGGFNVTFVDAPNDTGIATSSDRYYTNDEVDLGSGIVVTITEVIPYYSSFIYWFTWRGLTPPSVASYGTATILNFDAVVYLNQGDVYFRPIRLRLPDYYDVPNLPDKLRKLQFSYTLGYVESLSVSDFFASKSISKGKPYAVIEDAKTIRRRASVTYSDAFIIDSDRLNLSSFNLSLANWTDLDVSNGGIDRLINRGDALTVLQESKASQVPIGRNILEYANGDAGVSVSKNVLGVPSYYAGDFGSSGNPESVIERFGVVYFTDMNSRKVIRLSADGITPISDKGMNSYIQKLFEDLQKKVSTPKIVGGFDPDNDEYIITVEDFSQSTISVQSSDPELEPTVYEVEVDEDGNYVVEPTFAASAVVWNNINMDWNDICLEWENVGDGILNIETSELLLDALLIGSTGTIDILMTDNNGTFVAVCQYTFGTNVITVPSQTCSGRNIVTNFGASESKGITLAYDHKGGYWTSKYSFQPSNYANVGNALYSFFQNGNGLAWKHNSNDTRGLFYGVQYPSVFEVASNHNPSMIKVYQALGIEGGGNWTSVIETSTQKTEISEFDEREGHRYAMIPMDILNSKGHQIFLGTVTAVGVNTVTFSTPVNRLPFVIGDSIKYADGTSLITTGVSITGVADRKTLNVSGAGLVVGQNLFVEHQSIIDGDPIRDVYAKIKMTSVDTEPFEVHAISVHYDRSRLHNDRVN